MSKAIHTNISYETPERRNMNKDDRRNFIDHLFDVFETLDKSSKKQTAKQITSQYKEEHPDLKLNEMWVYRLLLAGIYKNDEGEYGFDNVDCDFDEMLSKPSILEKALRMKK